MALPAARRLRRQADFAALRAEGIRSSCGPFVLQFLPRQTPGGGRRFAVIASRRVGNAVKRHRGKRVFREIFRHNESLLPESGDCVVVLRAGFDRFPYADLERRFQRACASIGSGR
jgi:ribonuclease P protein component